MFAFKKFVIHQDHCAMKVGTDGVLLGSWANGGKRILDIGTGTGLIALMMAQRYTDAIIDAVEIDHDAALQAYENVSNTEFANRIKIVETAIQHYFTQDKYNAIVSNPPFFIDSLLNPNAQRSTARHACALKYCELFATVKALLDTDGEFSAIIPTECLQAFIAEAYKAGLAMSRQYAVRTTPRKQPKRHLVAFHHADYKCEREMEEVCLQNTNGSRSEWYAQLTADFYIK
jgi:tRNA1Val (adenine37-N6)-methyltransferase